MEIIAAVVVWGEGIMAKIKTEDVLELFKQEKTRKEIALELKADPKAIDYHLMKIRYGFEQKKARNEEWTRQAIDYNKRINWQVYGYSQEKCVNKRS